MSVTLKEAIEAGEHLLVYPQRLLSEKDEAALRLLIEAGKYVLNQYDPDHQMMRKLLPGEKPEELRP